jgi:transposase
VRLAVRHTRIAPLVAELEGWMRAERARLSRHAEVAKAMDYLLKRWPPSPSSSTTAASA